jgi:RNA-splicing ligase RtcB
VAKTKGQLQPVAPTAPTPPPRPTLAPAGESRCRIPKRAEPASVAAQDVADVADAGARHAIARTVARMRPRVVVPG